MEWQRKFAGYNVEDADSMVEQIEEVGGVAFKQREEGMEMGSDPHFQGYTVHFLPPLEILAQSKKVSRAGLPDEPKHGSTDIHVSTEIKSRRELAQSHLSMIKFACEHFEQSDLNLLREYVVRLADELLLIINFERMESLAAYNRESKVGLYGGRDK